jgi:Fe-S-cluster-containing dehydrogenase component
MDECRRTFLKKVGYLALGASCASPLLGAAGKALQEGLETTPDGKQWGLVIDVAKCRAGKVRSACREACHREHNVPRIVDDKGQVNLKEEVKWIWSEAYENAFPD